jgi:thiamine-phosphate pyrophosphorylase
MPFDLTPAAQRALVAAAGWTGRDEADDLRVPEVLLGLLDEPECRAALLLAAHGIDAPSVKQRFSDLRVVTLFDPARAERFSSEWNECLHAAATLLIEYPRPLVLATEHLLLGIAASDSEVAEWLAERGLNAHWLEAEIHRLSGHQPGPLPLETDDEKEPWDELAGEASSSDRMAVLRAIDAAANRANEGLRVLEDYVRFVLDDRHLTSSLKALRHDLAAALAVFPSVERHAARDTLSDVGTELTLASEQARSTPTAVAQANFKRVEQSLRSLEEFSKAMDAEVAATLEQLRYRVYTVERAADLTRDSVERLADANLYVLIDGGSSPDAFGELVASLTDARVSIIQLRDKQLADRELVTRARLLTQLTRGTATLSVVNDRADLALLADADGVHVGQDEISVKDARRILGPRRLVGVSTHSIEQARAAVMAGASYIGVGPTFPSTTKTFTHFSGLELLRSVHAEIRLPAFAIGGITTENLPRVLETGMTKVAVGAAVAAAANPRIAARQFVAALHARHD